MSYKISMIGAGSVGFSLAIAKELVRSEVLKDSAFVLMDIDDQKLAESEARIKALIAEAKSPLKLESTLDRRLALADADFVITSFAPRRLEFWARDIEIALRHGVELMQGENGGPAGAVHALRNITILMEIVQDINKLCPDAWLMNFTNPMSMLCTYLYKHTTIKSLGFCHQVHGSFGVIAEMLGFEPGDLQAVTAGINHMNFLLDIRKKGSDESYMNDFLAAVRQSKYWQKNWENIPEQVFTLDFLNTFGIYPVGYDNHICEYIPFFYSRERWKELNYRPSLDVVRELQKVYENKAVTATGTIDDVEPDKILGKGTFPFPKDPGGDYYKETPIAVMEALITAEPTYFDSMVLLNNGCVCNLPSDAVVDIPAVAGRGGVHGIKVRELPFFAAELCRRQIAIHELVVSAAISGDRRLLLEALCLDPFVHGIDTAKQIMNDYLEEYREYLPQFFDAKCRQTIEL